MLEHIKEATKEDDPEKVKDLLEEVKEYKPYELLEYDNEADLLRAAIENTAENFPDEDISNGERSDYATDEEATEDKNSEDNDTIMKWVKVKTQVII